MNHQLIAPRVPLALALAVQGIDSGSLLPPPLNNAPHSHVHSPPHYHHLNREGFLPSIPKVILRPPSPKGLRQRRKTGGGGGGGKKWSQCYIAACPPM